MSMCGILRVCFLFILMILTGAVIACIASVVLTVLLMGVDLLTPSTVVTDPRLLILKLVVLFTMVITLLNLWDDREIFKRAMYDR